MLHLSFCLRRLHSLTGLFIGGEFLLSHILANVCAVIEPNAIPPQNPVPTFFVLAMLLFHTVYGVYIALQANGNARHYPWMFNIQFSL